MSGGYADRLKAYPNKGVCGLPEKYDNERRLAASLREVVNAVREAQHLVIFTGAGISTAAGIPDFRGPTGIWTQEKAREKAAREASKRRREEEADAAAAAAAAAKQQRRGGGEEAEARRAQLRGVLGEEVSDVELDRLLKQSGNSVERAVNAHYDATARRGAAAAAEAAAAATAAAAAAAAGGANGGASADGGAGATPQAGAINFRTAAPTLTHRAFVELERAGKLRYLITQNVDGLDQRAGFPRGKMAVLHGCVFEEKCEDCAKIFFRDDDVGTISFQPTGRRCEACGGVLRDMLLDWEDPLPEDEFERSGDECEAADLVLSLGSSLRIEPAGSLPAKARRFIIVNLQKTPKDSAAALVVRTRVDTVMAEIMRELLGMVPDAEGRRWVPQ